MRQKVPRCCLTCLLKPQFCLNLLILLWGTLKYCDVRAEQHSCSNTTWMKWRSEYIDLLLNKTCRSSCWRPLDGVQALPDWVMSLNVFVSGSLIFGITSSPSKGRRERMRRRHQRLQLSSLLELVLLSWPFLLRRKQDGFLHLQHSKSTKSVQA